MPRTTKKNVVITYGTYDMLHVGHLNLLRRAKELGDYLIVGVTSEDYDRSRGKLNVHQSTEQRVEAIKKLSFVDEVIVEKHKFQKESDAVKYNVDIFAIGDDWVGKFDYLKPYCKVVYIPRTEGISSTQLRAKKLHTINVGIVGTGRIAHRFASEAKHVSSLELTAVMSRNLTHVEEFINKHDILYGFQDFSELLTGSNVDAVYIATPHETHFKYAKQALLAGKHVLCEKPISLEPNQLKELIDIALAKKLVLLEAVKTAFFPGFEKLLSEIKKGKIGDVIEVRASFSKLISDKNQREWSSAHGGAVTELATYPLLLAQKILGESKCRSFHSVIENDVDGYTTIIQEYDRGLSLSSVGIGAKTEGSAIIAGTKGYIYVPAPWWLTKEYFIRYENASMEKRYQFELDGDGLRYEISEFVTLIQRKKLESQKLSHSEMLAINKIFYEHRAYMLSKKNE